MGITLFLLFFLMIGAVSATCDSNDVSAVSDLTDETLTNSINTDAVDDNVNNNAEKAINNDNKLKSEMNYAVKMGSDDSGNVLKDSEITTVSNWNELKSAINDGVVIELGGDDVCSANSTIDIESGAVTINGKGHTIDAQGGNFRIFKVSNGATLILENLILKNANTKEDNGGAIYSGGTLTVTNCTFTNNSASSEKGGAIYNCEGALKIINSRFEKNSKFDRAIYNYGTEDNPFRLTIINTTMIEDKVCVNFEDNERKLDDKRDIDLLTTEVNAYIPEIIYEGAQVLINVSGIDVDFTGDVTVNITNTIYNTVINVANGEGSTTLNLDINRYTARLKNFISLTEDAFERDDTKPYLEINFKVAANNSFSAFEDMISKATDNVTLNQDYAYDSKTDSAYIRLADKTLTIYGNGHSINGKTNNGDTLFLIEDDSNVRMENITLENGHAQSRSHLGSQIRMGGAIFVSYSNLTIINSTLKNNKAEGGSGGAIYSEFSTLNIIESNFTNNDAANGKSLYIQGGNGVYILNSIIDEKDIANEPDWDNNDRLAKITILNNLNATLYIRSHVQGESTLINITEPKNFTGVANLTVNNTQENGIQITNGQASVNLNLTPGQYTATMTTPDIEYYADTSRNLTCTYLSANTTSNEFIVLRAVDIQLTVQNITYGETETITANIDAEGNVTINLDDEPIEDCLDIADGKIEYAIPRNITAGNHTVEVIYNGDTYTAGSSKSAKFTVNKAMPTISVSADSISYGEDVVVNIVASIDGEYNVTVGDKSEVATVENGIASVEFGGLGAGTYDVVAYYPGDDNHNNVSANTTVKVNKATPDIGISVKSIINYGEDLVVKITSDDNLAYRVNVTVGNQSQLLRLKEGKRSLKFSDLAPGSYTVTALYKGDANYSSISVDTAVVVKPIANLSLSVSASSTGVVVVNVIGDDDLAYRVNVTVGNQSKLLRLKDGKGTLKFDGFKAGTYDVVALYKGDADHVAVSVNTSVEINRLIPNLSVSASASGNGIVVVNVTCDVDLAYRVNVTVGNQSKLLRLKDGKGTLKFTDLEDGNYSVVALYKGDEDNAPVSVNDSVEIKGVIPNLSVSATAGGNGIVVVNVACDVDLAYRVNVTVGNQSKLLRLNEGRGSVKFSGLEVGTYDIVASYPGDANYKKASNTTAIEVKE